jgi:hypothetical protein
MTGHRLCSFLFWVVALTAPAWAQLTLSGIRGTVTDHTGAAIVNASVTIRNTEKGYERRLTTNAEGYYEAPDLQRGAYSIDVSAAGFSSFEAANVEVVSNEIRRVDV